MRRGGGRGTLRRFRRGVRGMRRRGRRGSRRRRSRRGDGGWTVGVFVIWFIFNFLENEIFVMLDGKEGVEKKTYPCQLLKYGFEILQFPVEEWIYAQGTLYPTHTRLTVSYACTYQIHSHNISFPFPAFFFSPFFWLSFSMTRNSKQMSKPSANKNAKMTPKLIVIRSSGKRKWK